MANYERTQIGWVTGLGMLPALVAAWGLYHAGLWAWMAVLALSVALLLLFGALTVRVSGDELLVRFGVGLVRRRIPLRDVRACRVVRNPWYYGWGIRIIPGGMLYSASGLSAVELTFADGRLFRVGTGEPEALAAAIRPHLPPDTSPGTAAPPPPGLPIGAKVALALLIVMIVGIAGTVVWFGQRPVQASIARGVFEVSGAGYRVRWPLDAITSVTMADAIPAVRRKINGYDFGSTLRGRFRLDELGECDLFVNRSAPPFVIVRSARGVLIVNQASPDTTRRLYADLAAQRPGR